MDDLLIDDISYDCLSHRCLARHRRPPPPPPRVSHYSHINRCSCHQRPLVVASAEIVHSSSASSSSSMSVARTEVSDSLTAQADMKATLVRLQMMLIAMMLMS